MIFLDTSAIYAWADARDSNHSAAVARLRAIVSSGEQFLTHNYVVLEAFTLLHARLGMDSATRFATDCDAFEIVWIDKNVHDAAIGEFRKSRKRRISLVDQISFLVMRRRNLRTAFAFDSDFRTAGFHLFEP
jgi:predicted nucleic acid-binding protein